MIELPEWPSSLTMRDNWTEGPFDKHRAVGSLPYDQVRDIVVSDAFKHPTTEWAERAMILDYVRHELDEFVIAQGGRPDIGYFVDARQSDEVALENQMHCLLVQSISEALALHGITDERVVVETARRVIWG